MINCFERVISKMYNWNHRERYEFPCSAITRRMEWLHKASGAEDYKEIIIDICRKKTKRENKFYHNYITKLQQ